MPLTFSDFSPASFSFEVRYPDAYLLWDRAGQLSEDLQNRHQITRLTTAQPGKIAYVVNMTSEVSWQLNNLVVIENRPSTATMDAFYRLCSDCFELTLRLLAVNEIKRVGFRMVFFQKFSSKDDAAAALLSAGLLQFPPGKRFNVDPVQRYPEYAIRCEDQKFGYMLRLLVGEVNYELDLTPQWKGNAVEPKHEDHLVLDFDYYSRASLPTGSFRVEEWLPQVLHVIRRDADSFLTR